ncbi:hypothetical protein HKBW3S25_00854, partial [Candidatus Hakubella thermalkaliphila]
YLEDRIAAGEGLPTPSDEIEVIDEPAVAVSL